MMLIVSLGGWTHGSTTVTGGFQVNLSFAQSPGSNIFINAMKHGVNWTRRDNQGSPLPSDLDTNGYPPNGSSVYGNTPPGVSTNFVVASQASRPGFYAIDWTGGCTMTVNVTNTPKTVSGNATTSPWIVDLTQTAGSVGIPVNLQQNVFLGITANSGSCSNVRMYYVASCTTLTLGNSCGDYDDITTGCGGGGCTYVQSWINTLKHGKVKTIRMYNWQVDEGGNTSISGTGQDKPLTYFCYVCTEERNSMYVPASSVSNVGANYSLNFGSGSPADKEQILVAFNATDGTTISSGSYNSGTGLVTLTLNASATNPSVGDQVQVTGAVGSGANLSSINGTFTAGAGTSSPTLTYTIATGLTITTITGGTAGGLPTLNLNSTGAKPIVSKYAQPCTSTCWPTANGYAAMVYDAQLNEWLKLGGGAAATGNSYLDNNVPAAALIEMCVEANTDCWFVMPPYSLDPDQGYDTAIANLA